MAVIYTRCLAPRREDRLSLVATVWSGADLGTGTEDAAFNATTDQAWLHGRLGGLGLGLGCRFHLYCDSTSIAIQCYDLL